jgi:hypothetical protein
MGTSIPPAYFYELADAHLVLIHPFLLLKSGNPGKTETRICHRFDNGDKVPLSIRKCLDEDDISSRKGIADKLIMTYWEPASLPVSAFSPDERRETASSSKVT